MRQYILMALMLFIAAGATAAAQDAPSMWMEQEGNTIVLMVNTSTNESGANAWVHFDPAAINITDVDVSMSPWTALDGPGWSHQGNYMAIALVNFAEVAAGEYQIAVMTVDCITTGETGVSITNAEPAGTIYNLTYVCDDATPPADAAVIAIGDASGTMAIPITVSGGLNVGACDITLSYDPTVVNVIGVSDGGMDCTYTNLEHEGDGWIRIGAVQSDSPGLETFHVLNVELAPVAEGMSCDLTLSVTTFKDATPAGNEIAYTISSGTYTSPTPIINGDADNSGTVDILDGAYIAKHLIGIAGYEAIDEDVANVNGDDILDMADSMYLTKHVMNVTGFENLG